MALSKTTGWKGTWDVEGCVQGIRVTTISDDDPESDGPTIKMRMGRVIIPGGDYAGEDKSVRQVCKALHTAEVIAAYQAAHPVEV